MRKKIVAGNWKMNLTVSDSIELVDDISAAIQNDDIYGRRIIVAPPFVNIAAAHDAPNRDHRLEVCAQNMHQEDHGAYTGEISAKMLLGADVSIVILGHSERREYFGETDALLKQKVDTALRNNMEVIFCFGEKLEDRKNGSHFMVVEQQIKNALFHIKNNDWKSIILAYEPVWAIGTGETASPEQAQEMHAFIRKTIATSYSENIANEVSILYGGSVKPQNASEIFGKPDVDGGLIGGAALDADSFVAIFNSF
jgi:triosephosphate isomerase